jgi:hypothetical protein
MPRRLPTVGWCENELGLAYAMMGISWADFGCAKAQLKRSGAGADRRAAGAAAPARCARRWGVTPLQVSTRHSHGQRLR